MWQPGWEGSLGENAAADAVTSVVSNSVRPHRRQPTRLPRPWDSPGKNTGVGCHCLLQCMKVKSESEVVKSLSCVQLLVTPWTAEHFRCSPETIATFLISYVHAKSLRLLCPRDSPGKNTRVGCHSLLQGIFPTQESNPHLLCSPALVGRLFTTSTTWEAVTGGIVALGRLVGGSGRGRRLP